MKVTVDRSLCVGSGTCVFTDPAVFAQDESDGLVTLVEENPGERPSIRKAAEACPVGAIVLV